MEESSHNPSKSTDPVILPNTEKSESEILEILQQQDRRRLTEFQANKLEKDAKRNWDIFYKNNTTNFFKDRHWTLREFQELLGCSKSDNGDEDASSMKGRVLLEVGCGVGNFVFPILKEVLTMSIFACDFSPRAVDFVKSNPDYDETRITAFVCDVTQESCFDNEECLIQKKADFVSLIFVLSAISPEKQKNVVQNLSSVTKPGGIVCFRDYGRYDMAQLRFKNGNKISDNFYSRRDGTRSYYFTPDEVNTLFTHAGDFERLECEYIHRRTVNLKEQVDVERIFVQAKFRKT